MADRDVEINLKVAVEGDDKVASLAGTLEKLGATAQTTTSSTSESLNTIAKTVEKTAATIQEAVKVTEKSSILPGETSQQWMARVYGTPADAEEQAKRSEEAFFAGRERIAKKMGTEAGKQAVMEGKSAASTLGELKETAAPAASALGGLGDIIGKLTIAGVAAYALHQLKDAIESLVSSTFGYVQDLAQSTLKYAASAERAQTDITTAQTDTIAGTTLLGKAYERLNQQTFKRFSEYRLGKGLAGDKEIFGRLGMTPETMTKAGGGRKTILDLMQEWSAEYQKMQGELKAAPTDEAKQDIQAKMAQFRADLGRISPEIANALASWTPQAIADLRAKIGEIQQTIAQPLNDEQLKAGATQFETQLASIKTIWGNIRDVIAGFSMQPIINFLDAVREKGNELGQALGNLGGTISEKIWSTLTELVKGIDAKSWVTSLQNLAKDIGETDIKGLGAAIAQDINDIASVFRMVFDALHQVSEGLHQDVVDAKTIWYRLTGRWKDLEKLQREETARRGAAVKPAEVPQAPAAPAADVSQIGTGLAQALDPAFKEGGQTVGTEMKTAAQGAGTQMKAAVEGASDKVKSGMTDGGSIAGKAIEAALVAGGNAAAGAIAKAMVNFAISNLGGKGKGADVPAPG